MTIRGPRSLGGPFAIYPPKKLIFATNRPVGETLADPVSYLGDWSYEASSDGPPLWTIGVDPMAFSRCHVEWRWTSRTRASS